MKVFLISIFAVFSLGMFDLPLALARGKDVCLKVNGELIEIHNLGSTPAVIDRDGVPDFVPTSMVTMNYNIQLSGIKRDDKKAISSFEVKIDDKAYSYPKDSCRD